MSKFKKLTKINYDSTMRKLNRIIGERTGVDSRCALATKLILLYGIRLGNEGSAEGYQAIKGDKAGEFVKTYGITTLKGKHIVTNKDKMFIKFLGKLQVSHFHEVKGDLLKRQLKWLVSTQGDTLFDVSAYHIRTFIIKHIDKDLTPKDLRMYRANELARKFSHEIRRRKKVKSKNDVSKEVEEICVRVSDVLGNTPQVSRRSYIDPRVLVSHAKGRLAK